MSRADELNQDWRPFPVPPAIYLNADTTPLPSVRSAPAFVRGDGVSVTFGRDSVLDDSQPAEFRFKVHYRSADMTALPLKMGDRVFLEQPAIYHRWRLDDDGVTRQRRHHDTPVFSGRIADLKASNNRRGDLIVDVTCMDYLSDLNGVYMDGNIPSSDQWIAAGNEHLWNPAFIQAAGALDDYGMRLDMLYPGRAAHAYSHVHAVPSIKAVTVLNNLMTQDGPRSVILDATLREYDDEGNLRAPVIRLERTARDVYGITYLSAALQDGIFTWSPLSELDTPLGEGLPSPIIPARAVDRSGISWAVDPDAQITQVIREFPVRLREETDTGADEYTMKWIPNAPIRRPDSDERGTTSVTVQDMCYEILDVDERDKFGALYWSHSNRDWKLTGVRIVRPELIEDIGLLAMLMDSRDRLAMWISIHGLGVRAPEGIYDAYRGTALNGELIWNYRAQRWEMALGIDTGYTLLEAADDTPLSFGDLANSGIPATGLASAANLADAGNTMTMRDFTELTEIREG
ncbi:hypothetical protein ACHABX_02645 [Nesterenkonia halotolerans]|uniref:hypothetical protein n=1 Tax=Nesterenkonia halotolerans TaxID=225325 RepID=UPI003EE4E1AF